MDRRHWALLAIAALLIGTLSLLFVEIDIGLEESINSSESTKEKLDTN